MAAPELMRQDEAAWSVADIGSLLFTEYAFAFEATSVLTLVAMVGAITLTARHVTQKGPWRP